MRICWRGCGELALGLVYYIKVSLRLLISFETGPEAIAEEDDEDVSFDSPLDPVPDWAQIELPP
jgi:hypothetical protein